MLPSTLAERSRCPGYGLMVCLTIVLGCNSFRLRSGQGRFHLGLSATSIWHGSSRSISYYLISATLDPLVQFADRSILQYGHKPHSLWLYIGFRPMHRKSLQNLALGRH